MSNIANLIKYFIECIEIESLEKFSFPSFKLNQNFINFPDTNEWSKEEDNDLTISPPEGFRRNLVLGGYVTSIYYGWPIYARPNTTREGKPYTWLEPVFILKVEFEKENTEYNLSLLKEWPKINDQILRRFASTIEERIQIIDSIGLSEAEELNENGLIEYWNKFNELFPDLVINENINDKKLVKTDFSNINLEGFYNRAILITASAPRYSRQLLKELRLLNKPDKLKNISSTSLDSLISSRNETIDNDYIISQISHLNRSQRNAVISAFSNELSVITGPPGTGKSQVVLNILSNAFEKNLTVLFSSKNNKAVDVVCERILNKINFPINLRLGARTEDRDYTIEFLNLLDSVLAGGDRDAIETEYERTKNAYDNSKKAYLELLDSLNQIVDIRNTIDKLDQEIEVYEKSIDEHLIKSIKNTQYRKSNVFNKAISELKIIESDKWPFIYRFISIFSNTYPYKKLHNYCAKCNELINNVLDLPSEGTLDLEIYEHFLEKSIRLNEYIRIYNNISELRGNLSDIDINKLSADVENAENEFVQKTTKYYELLGKKRMLDLSAQERQALTNYYSVIRQLAGEYPGNKAYARLKEQQEKLFRKISKILPVWSVTNLSAGGHFPFCENIFDLVIIDEASQSDIASAFPLLFRAKRAVIIGDPQQLRHITSIGTKQNNSLMEKYNLIEGDNLRFSYTTQSLYHCARGAVGENNVTLLNEHYRSHFSIIEFSNREWYTGSLDIRTNYSNLFFPPEGKNHIEWINITGNTIRPSGKSAFNKVEAEQVLHLLNEVFSTYHDKLPSIGIVTPFAAQAEFYRKKLIEQYDEDFIKKHFLIADTAHKFQGDERDIVIFSPVISKGVFNNSTTIGFLRSTSNLFNVSITRARSILWIVGDRNKCISAGIPYLKRFVEYIEHQKYKDIELPYDGFQSPWEKVFFEALVSEGFEPKSQYPAGPYFIDIALIQNNVRLAIEVDGERWHTNLTGEKLERDIVRDRNLYKMGWDVTRFWVHELKYNLTKCIETIRNKLNE